LIFSADLPEPEAIIGLAAGRSDEATAERLLSAQLDRVVLLATYAIEPAFRREYWPRPIVDAISRAQARAPRKTAKILNDAWLGAWTSRMLDGPPGAAWRLDVDAVVTVAVDDGVVHLPTLGSATVATGPAGAGTARVVVRDRTLAVDSGRESWRMPEPPEFDAPGWSGVRRMRAERHGLRFSLAVDDLSPLRDCFAAPLADRLPADRYDLWLRRFRGAWELLTTYARPTAVEMPWWSRTMVPLNSAMGRSATSHDAFGVFAMSLPQDAAAFAVTLVHERAHTVLNGLATAARLTDATDTTVHFAPWRVDPRPVTGLLHGAFAFVAVAELWRSLMAAPALRQRAQTELAALRPQLRSALSALRDSAGLTDAGHTVVEHLHRRAQALGRVALPVHAVEAGERDLRLRYDSWRRRNAVVELPGR
jgi:HEXXH motif-containing protein